MYENGIDVTYQLRDPDNTWGLAWKEPVTLHLPGWCAGDSQMAVTLYLHGHRDYVEDVHVIDWQPTVSTIEDSMQEFLVDDDDLITSARVVAWALGYQARGE